MPVLGELATLDDLGVGGVHPYTVEDILHEDDPASKMVKRGKLLYVSDFSKGLDDWEHVHNMTGAEPARPPLSTMVTAGGPALRIVASPKQAGGKAGAILRLARPWRDWGDRSVTISYYMTTIVLYAEGVTDVEQRENPFLEIHSGLDTQSWHPPGHPDAEREFFSVVSKTDDADPFNSDWTSLRFDKVDGSANYTTGTKGILDNVRPPQNENKTNAPYYRDSFQPGVNADYIESQRAGKVASLSGIVPLLDHPPQYSATDWQANFNGGHNPFFSVSIRLDLPHLLCAGILVNRIAVTAEDEWEAA